MINLDDIREELAGLDANAGIVREYLEDNEPDEGLDHELEDFRYDLEQLQSKITDIQEQNGWI